MSDDPFAEIERLFDTLSEFGTGPAGDVPADVVDEGDAFVVVLDLPGFATDDIDVQLTDERHLQVTAERTDERFSDGDYVTRERQQYAVTRTVSLPGAVDADETEASHENGVLTVRLGKQTADEGTDIPVN